MCVTFSKHTKDFFVSPPVGIRYERRGIETKENRIFNKGENCWPLQRI